MDQDDPDPSEQELLGVEYSYSQSNDFTPKGYYIQAGEKHFQANTCSFPCPKTNRVVPMFS